MSEFNQARREGMIKFGYDFSTLAEVTHLWGLKATKLPYRVCFRIPGKENALCCLLSEQGGNGWKNVPHYGAQMDSRGWREILRIDESNADEMVSAQRIHDELENPQERYVFWRESREGAQWYKFYGVFEIDKDATRASAEDGELVCIYRRKSEEGTCPKCDMQVKSIPAVDVTGLKGKILEANLMDEVHYELKAGKRKTEEVKVWPGQRLWVKEASESSPCLVCQTSEGDFLQNDSSEDEAIFFIPRRDLELGYFKVVGEGTLDDAVKGIKPTEIDVVDESMPPAIPVGEKFEEFWRELTKWWKIPWEGEELSIKRGKVEFRLRCGWDVGILTVAMISPWPCEWDYAELYGGMFGWNVRRNGFNKITLRKKVANLLLDEIIKRQKWMFAHPGSIAEREKDIERHFETRKAKEPPRPHWFEEYAWTRSRAATIGEGDMHLYVEGRNHLFGAPIMCQWAIQDMIGEEEARDNGK